MHETFDIPVLSAQKWQKYCMSSMFRGLKGTGILVQLYTVTIKHIKPTITNIQLVQFTYPSSGK